MIPFISTSLHNRLEKELTNLRNWTPVMGVENNIFKCYFVRVNPAGMVIDPVAVNTTMYMKSLTEENAILNCFMACAEEARKL